MLGFQRRRVRRCECETDMPKPGPLPQTSQTAATSDTPRVDEQVSRDSPGRETPGYLRLRGGCTDPTHPPRRLRKLRRIAIPCVATLARVPPTLDAALLTRWSRAATTALEQNCAEIDRINVFPVADGDTGTNLLL